MTSEQQVVSRFPGAFAHDWYLKGKRTNPVWFIYPDGQFYQPISRGWSTAEKARDDAAVRVEGERNAIAGGKSAGGGEVIQVEERLIREHYKREQAEQRECHAEDINSYASGYQDGVVACLKSLLDGDWSKAEDNE